MHCTLCGWILNFSTFWHRLKCVCSTHAQIHHLFKLTSDKKKEIGSLKVETILDSGVFFQRKV